MSTMILVVPPTIAWEFDGDLRWRENHRWTPTKKRVEGRGKVSDYVAEEPWEGTVTGVVSATQIDPNTLESNPQRQNRLQSARDTLIGIGRKRERVEISSARYTGPVVITGVSIEETAEGGKKLDITISFQEVEGTTPQTATIDASRLRKKVKKRVGAPKGGGQSFAPRTGSPAEQRKTKEIILQKFGKVPFVARSFK